MDSLLKLKEILPKGKIFGDSDDIVKKHKTYIGKKQTFVGTKNALVCGMPGSGKRCRYQISKHDNLNSVLKNIRFENNHLIKSIELSFGVADRIDKIYNHIDGTFDTIRHILHIDDKTIVPFGCLLNDFYLPLFGDFEVFVEFKPHDGDFSYDMTYDVYEVDDVSDLSLCMLPRIEFSGEESCMHQCAKFKLDFCYITTHIFCNDLNNDFDTFNFVFNGNSFTPNLTKHNNFYIAPFVGSFDIDDIIKYGINPNPVDYIILNVKLANPPRKPSTDEPQNSSNSFAPSFGKDEEYNTSEYLLAINSLSMNRYRIDYENKFISSVY